MSATGSAGRRWRGQRGFTLIEALVVVAVGALIAGIMFPELEKSVAFLQFRSASTAVRAGLGRGRAAAIRYGVDIAFAVAPDGRSFEVSGEMPVELPAAIALRQSGTSPILFHRDGSASGGSIRLVAGGRGLLIAVSPDTGLIRRAQ